MNTSDNSLMQQVRAGELGHLAVLFERHHRALFRYFVAMNRDRGLAEDLVQDVFFRILRYRQTYNEAQSFTAWMYRIARNAGIDHARKRKGDVVDIDDFADRRETASTQPNPEQYAARRQNLELLRRAMDQLPGDKRELLVLSRIEGMKYEDIAALLGCEVATIKVRVFRAVRALEQIYLNLEQEKVS